MGSMTVAKALIPEHRDGAVNALLLQWLASLLPRGGAGGGEGGAVGLSTRSRLSLARTVLSVLIVQADQNGDPGLASAGNLANIG